MSTRIERAYPVNPALPSWRSEFEQSLEAAFEFWICLQRDMGRVAHATELDAGTDASDLVGAVEIATPARSPGAILVTQAGMTAFFSEHGIECATLRALDHVVCELVECDYVAPERDMRELAGIGNVVVYRANLEILGVWG